MQIRRVAIVGGGAAGWLCANHFGLELIRNPNVTVTVIESENIPSIGVGEGTVPAIRNSLRSFGIDEADLLLRCDATFKTGVKFSNWMQTRGKLDNFYYHSFDLTYPGGYDVTPFWLGGQSVEYSKLSKAYALSEKNRCPKHKDSRPYEGVVNYAYHFDAASFTELLAENAVSRFGVERKIETVKNVLLHDDGSIKACQYESGEVDSYDFYVDCSGFSSILFSDALKVPFVDKAHEVITDSALALAVPLGAEDAIPPYTKAEAHAAGWIWDIPLQGRRGTGFVYSSAHMSDEQALRSFGEYHGEVFASEYVRKIPMKAGYRKKLWEKNCIALGLAGGFVEPLEATSLYITDFFANMVSKRIPEFTEDCPLYAESCNSIATTVWERVMDFIRLHYAISNRRDSDFWVDVTEKVGMSDVLRGRLELWERSIPQKTDFPSTYDFFLVESYLMVLFGMNYPTRPPAMSERVASLSSGAINEHLRRSELVADSLTSHRQWLGEFNRYSTRMRT